MVADLTGNYIFDMADLEVLSEEWLTAGVKADICADGIVDFIDFTVLANEWMTENLWP